MYFLMGGEIFDMATIEEVKERNANQLLNRPEVVSVGVGLDQDGGKVIVIGLDRDRPEILKELPSEIEGYPVRVEIIGVPHAR